MLFSCYVYYCKIFLQTRKNNFYCSPLKSSLELNRHLYGRSSRVFVARLTSMQRTTVKITLCRGWRATVMVCQWLLTTRQRLRKSWDQTSRALHGMRVNSRRALHGAALAGQLQAGRWHRRGSSDKLSWRHNTAAWRRSWLNRAAAFVRIMTAFAASNLGIIVGSYHSNLRSRSTWLLVYISSCVSLDQPVCWAGRQDEPGLPVSEQVVKGSIASL